MERATQDGYITHGSIHEKIIMHQPSWSYASSIIQPSWRWSYKKRATQDGYITHRSIHEKIIMHQPSWSYASSKTQPSWRCRPKHGKSYASGYITHRSIHEKIIIHQHSWSYASSITQPSWRRSYENGKSCIRWLHHTPINTRKDYHASTFMIIRIKHNPTILALEFKTWKELHQMDTSHTDQNTKRLSCINLHDRTHQA